MNLQIIAVAFTDFLVHSLITIVRSHTITRPNRMQNNPKKRLKKVKYVLLVRRPGAFMYATRMVFIIQLVHGDPLPRRFETRRGWYAKLGGKTYYRYLYNLYILCIHLHGHAQTHAHTRAHTHTHTHCNAKYTNSHVLYAHYHTDRCTRVCARVRLYNVYAAALSENNLISPPLLLFVREVAENLIYPRVFWLQRSRGGWRYGAAAECIRRQKDAGQFTFIPVSGFTRAQKRRQKQPVHAAARRPTRPPPHGVPACSDNSELTLIIHASIRCIHIYIYIYTYTYIYI